jgi:peptidoglycan/xylan/chitin deacetylase (PgdA/CDA1 family)
VVVWLTIATHLALAGLLLRIPALDVLILGQYVAYHAAMTWAFVHPRSRLFGPNLSHLPTRERVVALTFDDGPHPDVTPEVLAVLEAHGAKATFFLIGKWAERYPEQVRQIVAAGHVVGNHTFRHSYLFWANSPRRIREDVARAQDAILAAGAPRCRWFRAPVGIKNFFLHAALARLGLTLVSWDIRLPDAAEREGLVRRLRGRITPGSIVLLHDGHDRRPEGRPAIVETLPLVLREIDAMGYRCVALGD